MSRKAAARLGFTVETPAIALLRSFSGNEVRGTFFMVSSQTCKILCERGR